MDRSVLRRLGDLGQWALLLSAIAIVTWLSSLGLATRFGAAAKRGGHAHDPAKCATCRRLRETNRLAPRVRDRADEEVSPPLFGH